MGYCWLTPASTSAYTNSLWNSVCRLQTTRSMCLLSGTSQWLPHVITVILFIQIELVQNELVGIKKAVTSARLVSVSRTMSAPLWLVSSAVSGQLGCSVPDCQLLREFQAQLMMQLHAAIPWPNRDLSTQPHTVMDLQVCESSGGDTASATAGCTDKLEFWWPSTDTWRGLHVLMLPWLHVCSYM